MPRLRTLFAFAAIVALAVIAAPAHATTVELGSKAHTTPSCPDNPCLVVDRTTGYQTALAAQANPYVVTAAGRIVAWTVTLSDPNATQLASFDKRLGGPASAQIVVVRPGKQPVRGGTRQYRLVAAADLQQLEPYLGTTVQFPLTTTLAVQKGDIVALTIPTWAPVLAVGMDKATIWRSSRAAKSCNDTTLPTAQTQLGVQNPFGCTYRTAALTYSATLIPNPVPVKKTTTTTPTTPPKKGSQGGSTGGGK
jgi:hypothetical protein